MEWNESTKTADTRKKSQFTEIKTGSKNKVKRSSFKYAKSFPT